MNSVDGQLRADATRWRCYQRTPNSTIAGVQRRSGDNAVLTAIDGR